MTAPFSFGAVANLIVILQVAEKRVAENSFGRSSMPASAKCRITAVMDENPLDCFGQIRQRAEIGIVTIALAGEHSMQRMMEIIAPLGVDTVTADLLGADDFRIVEIALGDHDQMPAALGLQFDHLAGQLFKKMGSRGVDQRVHRIEAQPIEVIIAQPDQSVIAYKTPNFIAVRSVEIYRLSPGRGITLGEIGPEARQIIPRRSQVVVNDIENHRQAAPMTGIYQTLQLI